MPPEILQFLARRRFSLFGVTVGLFSQEAINSSVAVRANKKYFMLYMIYLTVKATNYN